MQKFILDIFDKVSVEIPDLPEAEKELAEQIEAIAQALDVQVPQEYHDEISRRLFEASCIAERKGFELGVKYMAKLLYECLS